MLDRSVGVGRANSVQLDAFGTAGGRRQRRARRSTAAPSVSRPPPAFHSLATPPDQLRLICRSCSPSHLSLRQQRRCACCRSAVGEEPEGAPAGRTLSPPKLTCSHHPSLALSLLQAASRPQVLARTIGTSSASGSSSSASPPTRRAASTTPSTTGHTKSRLTQLGDDGLSLGDFVRGDHLEPELTTLGNTSQCVAGEGLSAAVLESRLSIWSLPLRELGLACLRSSSTRSPPVAHSPLSRRTFAGSNSTPSVRRPGAPTSASAGVAVARTARRARRVRRRRSWWALLFTA